MQQQITTNGSVKIGN